MNPSNSHADDSPLSQSTTAALAIPARRALTSYIAGLAPVILVWAILVGWLAKSLFDRASWSVEADQNTVREWLDEARNFRKTLPELLREYVALREQYPLGDESPLVTIKREEIQEHMHSLVEPTRMYINQLPSFPEIYRISAEVRIGDSTETLAWASPLPQPRQSSQGVISTLEYRPMGDHDDRLVIQCEYKLHAFNRLQRQEEEHHRRALVAIALLFAATLLAVLFVLRFLQRERQREMQRLTALAEAEHHERALLEARLQQRETEQAKRDLDERLLRQKLESADLERRAAEAEKSALELKSQLYASIGIMAGSYAHNIKNLLVRPNDLLNRCIEVNGLSPQQEGMLSEVKNTLGTVTERLQQILRTVRRDPTESELTEVDLNRLIHDSLQTWQDVGRDKWKLQLTAELSEDSLVMQGDLSHLQQAIENLIFNARDATFEMRNHLRDLARADHTPDRKQRLIEAASWKGEVKLLSMRTPEGIVLKVIDNGIGMNETVQENCLRTHFSTKRNNALYEGYNAGMGLGLSFVAMVLEHHAARLKIESAPLQGTTFTITFPQANPTPRPPGDTASPQ